MQEVYSSKIHCREYSTIEEGIQLRRAIVVNNKGITIVGYEIRYFANTLEFIGNKEFTGGPTICPPEV